MGHDSNTWNGINTRKHLKKKIAKELLVIVKTNSDLDPNTYLPCPGILDIWFLTQWHWIERFSQIYLILKVQAIGTKCLSLT